MSQSSHFFREDYSGQSDSFQVDFDNAVVHNVKILGWKSRNKRNYIPDGVDASLYEGAFVNVDHSNEASKSPVGGLPVDRAVPVRSVRSRFARLTGVTKKADGLYADKLTCNPEHSFTKEFLWWAKNFPDAVVLSHHAAGPRRMERDGSCTVLAIKHVESVDIVSKGGVNATLYESESMPDIKLEVGELVVALFPEADLETIKTKLKSLEAPPAFTGDVNAALGELRETSDPRVRILVESYQAKIDAEAIEDKRKRAAKACSDAKLPEPVVTAVFLETLVGKPETEWAAQISDRKTVSVIKTGPTSGNLPTGPTSTDDFVKNFRSRN